MRIIAIGLVIFNHLAGYKLYMISDGLKQWFYMFLTMLTRINVPLFLMISGALLLGRDEDFGKVIKKRVSRFLMVIFIFEAGLFLLNGLMALSKGNGYNFSAAKFFFGVLAGNLENTGSYWYLYAYLGFLFSLPFMQRVARGMKKQDFWVLLILHFVFSSVIPILKIMVSIRGGVYRSASAETFLYRSQRQKLSFIH